jgi:hypothetical protein
MTRGTMGKEVLTITVDDENFVRAETDRMFAGLQYVYDIVGASTETTDGNELWLQPLAAHQLSFRQLRTERSGR